MASPFSFHCMICFEEFQIESRYPVVLPCGHTYLCNQCAVRLDKCMECRTSLFQMIPRGPAEQHGRWGSRPGPGHRHHAPPTPPQSPVKKRLPLPKNVVLMSLIEATELAAENVRGLEQQPSLTESPMMNIAPAVLDEDEEEKIKAGTSLAISDCGTYAVAARDGLEIFPSRPSSAFPSGREESESDVDTLVRVFHLDHMFDLEKKSSSEKTSHLENGHQDKTTDEATMKDAPPVRLSLGDRVQIVSTKAEWAKLARGYGYVRAGRHQLVKVGGSVDRACKLEALLRLLSTRRKELKREQMRVDNQFIALMNELRASLMSGEDLTVIAAATFHNKAKYAKEDAIPEVRDNVESSVPPLGHEVRSNNYGDSTPLKPRPMERPITPPGGPSLGFFCSGADVLDSLSAGITTTQPPALLSSSLSPAIAAAFARVQSSASAESTPTGLLNSASHPSPGALKAGARAWREMHGRQASVNVGIDFRTGMSGHGALTSNSVHPHDYLGPRTGNSFLGMSNHTGLTMWKPPWRRQPARNSNLAMPTFQSQRGDGSTLGSSSPTTSTK